MFKPAQPGSRLGRLAGALPSWSAGGAAARLAHGGPHRRIVEDPEGLGYRLVTDPLLEIMDAERWYSLEHAARG
jgi:hypothetical protein